MKIIISKSGLEVTGYICVKVRPFSLKRCSELEVVVYTQGGGRGTPKGLVGGQTDYYGHNHWLDL